jgi:hypothetical protein
VLLYHFDGADDLLQQAIWKLRERRIANSLAAVSMAEPQTLADSYTLIPLDQPARFAEIIREFTRH